MEAARRSRLAATTGALVLVVTAQVVAAARHVAVVKPANLRSLNERIDEVYGVAFAQSATFRQLIASVEMSGVIVYVEGGTCRHGTIRSCISIMLTPGVRRLLIHIDPMQVQISVMSQLAHELYHAVEIAGAADVVDAVSLRRLYERIGFSTWPGDGLWETRAALAIEQRVKREIVSARQVTSDR